MASSIQRIWSFSNRYRDALTSSNYGNLDQGKALIGGLKEVELTTLTLNAEILLRISQLRDDQNYLLHPRTMVINCIRTLARNETKRVLKENFQALL